MSKQHKAQMPRPYQVYISFACCETYMFKRVEAVDNDVEVTFKAMFETRCSQDQNLAALAPVWLTAVLIVFFHMGCVSYNADNHVIPINCTCLVHKASSGIFLCVSDHFVARM